MSDRTSGDHLLNNGQQAQGTSFGARAMRRLKAEGKNGAMGRDEMFQQTFAPRGRRLRTDDVTAGVAKLTGKDEVGK